jgi:hypothetical protein
MIKLPGQDDEQVSDGVLEDKSLASRRLEDTFSSPWPWPRAGPPRLVSPRMSLYYIQYRTINYYNNSFTVDLKSRKQRLKFRNFHVDSRLTVVEETKR